MSDHGMFYGERGLSDCWLLYEDPICVPLIIFDPRLEGTVRRSTTIKQMALNLDIAPTTGWSGHTAGDARLQCSSLTG